MSVFILNVMDLWWTDVITSNLFPILISWQQTFFLRIAVLYIGVHEGDWILELVP